MVQSIKQNASKETGIGITRLKMSNQILQMRRKLTNHTHFDSSEYVLMIDFKYSVVMLLILIGFAMFTCG